MCSELFLNFDFEFKIVWVLRCTCNFELLEILLWLYLYLTHSYQRVTILSRDRNVYYIYKIQAVEQVDTQIMITLTIKKQVVGGGFDLTTATVRRFCEIIHSMRKQTFMQSLLYKTFPILCTTVIIVRNFYILGFISYKVLS